jgi:hypothetical protein
MTPTEAFWSLLRTFRDDTLIIQICLTIGMALITWMVFFKPGKTTDVATKLFLAAAFFWNGVACFLIVCSESMVARFLGGPLFMTIGFLFLVDLFITRQTRFAVPKTGSMRAVTAFFILLAFLFPVLGIFTGHPFIALPGFPCPFAGFTLALLAAATPRVDKGIYCLTLIWAFVNIPKCFGLYDCYEEVTLVLTGFYSLAILKHRSLAEASPSLTRSAA